MDYSLFVGIHFIDDCSSKHAAEDTCVVNCEGKSRKAVLYMGIIDILTEFDVKRKLENAFKRVFYKQEKISAVNHEIYGVRFNEFVKSRLFK
jgi:hypothetical protein